MTIDEQIAEIDKTIAMLVKARRTLLAIANVSRKSKEKQNMMEDCISRKQFYDYLIPIIPKPPIDLKE